MSETPQTLKRLAREIRNCREHGDDLICDACEEKLDRILVAALEPCQREHVEYKPVSRSDNRFFGDENNG